MTEQLTSALDSLVMNLNGNRLKLGKNGRWELVSSELDLATLEIEKLVTEKEELAKSFEKALEQIDLLSLEIRDINQAKAVMLEMLMSERQQRIALENQIEGYKEELKESFKQIVELKRRLSFREDK
eukprot:gene1039-1101_t